MPQAKILVVDDKGDFRNSFRLILGPDVVHQEVDDITEFYFTGNEPFTISDEIEFLHDDTHSELFVEEALQTGHYIIVEASQGLGAVKIIKKSMEENRPFCLIFLGLHMPPGMNGIKTAQMIRQLDPSVEIVIMTDNPAYSFEKIAEQIENPDRLLYFNKSFKPAQIKQLVSALTQKWYLEKRRHEQDQMSDKEKQ